MSIVALNRTLDQELLALMRGPASSASRAVSSSCTARTGSCAPNAGRASESRCRRRYNWGCRPGDRGPLGGPRKVRTPQGRTLGKPQAAKADGKWHRKETATGDT